MIECVSLKFSKPRLGAAAYVRHWSLPVKNAMVITLIVLAALYIAVLVKSILRRIKEEPGSPWMPSLHQNLIGFVTNFFFV